MPVSVIIRYYGRYAERTGLAEEPLEVDGEIEKAYHSIAAHLAANYKIQPPYNIIINEKHLMGAIKLKMQLQDGDVFHVFPFMSGG